MNIFRLAGDMSHVFSIIVLLLRLRVAKNAQGKRRADVVYARCASVMNTFTRTIRLLIAQWLFVFFTLSLLVSKCPTMQVFPSARTNCI